MRSRSRGCLTAVHRLVVFGIVAHECLDECRFVFLNLRLVLVAVFKLELILSALFGGQAGDIALLDTVAQDAVAELGVNQNACAFFRHTFASATLNAS